MTTGDADLLARLERRAVVVCGVMAIAALVVSGGRVAAPAGVLGGGVLAVVSYRGIKDLATALTLDGSAADRRGNRGRTLARLLLRYALLGLLAYGKLALSRLLRLGLLAGGSCVVSWFPTDAARLLLKKS